MTYEGKNLRRNDPVARGISTAFLVSNIVIMLAITYAASIANRTSFDLRSHAVYPTVTPIRTPTRTPTPIPTPPKPNGVYYYNQTDKPWGDFIVGGGCKFKDLGCGTTVTASILSTKKSLIWRPDYTYKKLYPYLSCSGFGAQDINTKLTQQGVSLTQLTGKNGDEVKSKVVAQAKAYKKVIVGANIKKPNGTTISHITLAVAYSSSLIFNDPLFGAGIQLEANRYTINWDTAIVYVVN